jgi:hypothetical protein
VFDSVFKSLFKIMSSYWVGIGVLAEPGCLLGEGFLVGFLVGFFSVPHHWVDLFSNTLKYHIPINYTPLYSPNCTN